METLCTTIATGRYGKNHHDVVYTCEPIKDAIRNADDMFKSGEFETIRVYAETNNGATLTLVYAPDTTAAA